MIECFLSKESITNEVGGLWHKVFFLSSMKLRREMVG